MDLALDLTTWDLQWEDNDLVVIEDNDDEGAIRTRQTVGIRLKLHRGEWGLNTGIGVPYAEMVLVRNPDVGTIGAVIRTEITDVEGVDSVYSLTVTFNATRQATVTAFVNTPYGRVDIGQIGPA